MHDSVMEFAERILTDHIVVGTDIIEVGSYDVNGSVRRVLEKRMRQWKPGSYIGIDIRKGPSVDMVISAAEFGEACPDSADIVICAETLEHCEDWKKEWYGIVEMMRSHAYLLLTARGPGFAKHDHPGDYWRFDVDTLMRACKATGLKPLECIDDPECPGVLLWARKASPYLTPGSLDEIGACPVGQ